MERVCIRFFRKTGSCACLALCDIDHFKAVNDTHGHLQGDMVLREVGQLLKSSMREHFDLAGRYGGEEFLMIFDETSSRTCFEIVERIRKKIESHKFMRIDATGAPVKHRFLSITVSIGISDNLRREGSDKALGQNEWIARTDQALYRAKNQGRNQTRIWDTHMPNPL